MNSENEPNLDFAEDEDLTKLDAEQVESIVETALACLADQQQKVIKMRHQQKLPFAKIAIELNRSEKDTQAMWAEAIELMSRQLK